MKIFTKESKRILELKNRVSEIKNPIYGFKLRLNTTEERIDLSIMLITSERDKPEAVRYRQERIRT